MTHKMDGNGEDETREQVLGSNLTKTPSREMGEEAKGGAKRALRDLEQLHEEIGKRERQLEINVEATRQEVMACFQRCQRKLQEREEALLGKLHQEHRRLKRALLAPKRMAVNVNHASLNSDSSMVAFSEGEPADGHAMKTENGIPVGALLCNRNNNGETELDKVLQGLQRALDLANTPFHLSRADEAILRQFDDFVDHLGTVYLGDADPSRTIVNAHPALVLAENTAKVKGVNQKGEECRGGGANICASLRNQEGTVTLCKVEDCLNGIYKIYYTPQKVGIHFLQVEISGDPISNSPLEVEVKPIRLLPNKAFIGGNCSVAMEMPREYNLPVLGKDGKELGKTQKLSLQSLKIAILDPEGNDVEASVAGSVQRRGVICTYTLKYVPKVAGFHEIKVSRLGQDGILLAHVVMPVSEREQMGRRGHGRGQFDNPTDVLVTCEGDLIVADTVENERVQCLTPDGQFKYDFPFPGQEPTLLAANSKNIAALLLNAKRVRILTLQGRQVQEFGHDDFTQPYGIAINSDNQVYVSDRGAHCVFVFSSEGKLWRQIGKHGSGPGEFDFPNYIFIDPSDNLFVTEAKNCRIQIFKPTGEYTKEVRSLDKLPQPGAVVATASGYLLVHNESDNRVQILNLDTNRFISSVLVDLIAPYTRRIAVTRTGFLVALDMSSHCLWRYPIPFE
ncbi:tripartite motif-containing protein 3-like [Acanthaster planci]|uniref:Tripartite motif-containing protein 3-like n=1 Tax=Acanthaster planci TaxID=133434 RepID=A0A8B7XGL7_ACAPL|nr:tripartite motif-containing protein 3-like [Acanthaster planci]